MKKTGRFIMVFPALVLLLVLTLNHPSAGKTLKVCKIGCEFSSIGEALNNTDSGDTIRVQNGNYSENLRIDRDLTIIGTNSSWVRISPSNSGTPALVIGPSSGSVRITNVTLTGDGSDSEDGLVVTGDGRITLKNSRIVNFQNGLVARNSAYIKLRETEVGSSGTGVGGFDNSEVILSGSEITSAKRGIIARDSSTVTVVDTEINNCGRNSVLAEGTAKLNVLSSSVVNNRAPGVVLRGFSRMDMEDTQVSSNEGGGILLTDSAIANLTDNRITYNKEKNVSVISKRCGFSGPSNLFFGEVNGVNNAIKPVNSSTVCPAKFGQITSGKGGSYSFPFKPSTYAFIGLIGIATAYFLIAR